MIPVTTCVLRPRVLLIAILVYWASLGVDGFRCDVAPFVPLAFWKRAKQAVAEINPETIWFSESVEPVFLVFLRQFGATALSDSEIFQVFNLYYDYDVYPYFKNGYVEKRISLPILVR